eukprot:2283462-Rhodomonas_salina.3
MTANRGHGLESHTGRLLAWLGVDSQCGPVTGVVPPRVTVTMTVPSSHTACTLTNTLYLSQFAPGDHSAIVTDGAGTPVC